MGYEHILYADFREGVAPFLEKPRLASPARER